MSTVADNKSKGSSACAWAGKLAIAGIVLAAAGVIIPRVGVSPMIAMLLITVGSLTMIIGAIFGITGLVKSSGTGGGSSAGMAWLAIVLGGAAILNVFVTMGSGRGAPAIHDISTDMNDPPAFIAVAALRGPNENTVEYSAEESSALQAKAFPDIQTIVLLDARSFVFQKALEVAEDMGWEIVASDAAEGRIEATATTSFVGFKDDVVIRVQAKGAETHVDVRSKSRIGRGDMGVNAARVRKFSEKLVSAANP